MQNVSYVVEEISFGDSVMPFHQNRFFSKYNHAKSSEYSDRNIFAYRIRR